jgi:hypothetical protein
VSGNEDPWEAPPAEFAELEGRITVLVKRLPRAIETARKAAKDARDVLAELIGCGDEELDTHADDDLRVAWQRLNSAAVMARERLKLIEDAERDAELTRLRARNAELEQMLAEGGASRG